MGGTIPTTTWTTFSYLTDTPKIEKHPYLTDILKIDQKVFLQVFIDETRES